MIDDLLMELPPIFDTNLKFDLDKNASEVIINQERYQIKENDHRRSVKYTHMIKLSVLTNKKPNIREEDAEFWEGRQLKLPHKDGADPNLPGEYPKEVDMVMILEQEVDESPKFSDIDAAEKLPIPYKLMASFNDEKSILQEINGSLEKQNRMKTEAQGYDTSLQEYVAGAAEKFFQLHKGGLVEFVLAGKSEEEVKKYYESEIKQKTNEELEKLQRYIKDMIKVLEDRIQEYQKIYNSIKNKGIEQRTKVNQRSGLEKFFEEISKFKAEYRKLDETISEKRFEDEELLRYFKAQLEIYKQESCFVHLKKFQEKRITDILVPKAPVP